MQTITTQSFNFVEALVLKAVRSSANIAELEVALAPIEWPDDFGADVCDTGHHDRIEGLFVGRDDYPGVVIYDDEDHGLLGELECGTVIDDELADEITRIWEVSWADAEEANENELAEAELEDDDDDE